MSTTALKTWYVAFITSLDKLVNPYTEGDKDRVPYIFGLLRRQRKLCAFLAIFYGALGFGNRNDIAGDVFITASVLTFVWWLLTYRQERREIARIARDRLCGLDDGPTWMDL